MPASGRAAGAAAVRTGQDGPARPAPRIAVVVGSEDGHLPASDRAAVGLAVRRLGGRVEAWTLRDDEAARRYALAAGAVSASVLETLDGLAFDVALVGAAGAQPWGDLLAATLAERGGGALLLDVLDVTPCPDGLLVTRDLGRGAREELVVAGPAVLGVSPEAAPPLYVSRHRQATVPAAAPAPGARGAAGRLADPLAGAAGPWEAVRPRARGGDARPGPAGPAHERRNVLLDAVPGGREGAPALVAADARTCARHLVRYLGHLGVVERLPEPAVPPATPAAPAGAPGPAVPEREAAGPATPSDPRLTRRPRPLGGPPGPGRGPSPVA